MNAKQAAVNDIRMLGRTLKGMLALADELERVGSLEGATQEIDARYKKAVADETAAKADLAEAVAKLEGARSEAGRVLDSAKTEAARIVKAAEAKGEAAVLEARKLAQDAEDKAAKAVAFDAARGKQLADDLAKVEGQIRERKAALAAIEKQIADLKAKLG